MTLEESVQLAVQLIQEGELAEDEIAEKTGLNVRTVDELRIQCIQDDMNS